MYKKSVDNDNALTRKKNQGQRGFALIELILAISISAILAIYANQAIVNQSQENIATGGGIYLQTITQAVERHVLINFNDLANGVDVAGTAADLSPTIPELIALGRLLPGYPQVAPTRQIVNINIIRDSCPGPTCQVTSLVCTTTGVTLGGANVRYDLANAMYEAQAGRGGLARYGDGANIRGPGVNRPNPNGNVPGVVCGTAFVDVGMFDAFVRINDTRDPNLQGPLTVAGPTTLNGATAVNNNLTVTGNTTIGGALNVTGATNVGPCINLAGGANGRAAFGCTNANDLPAGYTGGVRSADVVASANILASTNAAGFTGNNGDYALVTANNGAGEAEIRTSGRAAADRLTPTGQFASGAACAAADEGSIARLAGGAGLVTCTAGSWRVFTFETTVGAACAPDGATARTAAGQTMLCVGGVFVPFDQLFRTGTVNGGCVDLGATAIDTANNNETLICRINLAGGTARWMRLRDVTSHLSFVQAVEVGPGAVVTKPFCNTSPLQTSTQIIQLIPKAWGSPDGGQAFFATDNGATWTVNLKDGHNVNLLGNPNAKAIAQLYCYFP